MTLSKDSPCCLDDWSLGRLGWFCLLLSWSGIEPYPVVRFQDFVPFVAELCFNLKKVKLYQFLFGLDLKIYFVITRMKCRLLRHQYQGNNLLSCFHKHSTMWRDREGKKFRKNETWLLFKTVCAQMHRKLLMYFESFVVKKSSQQKYEQHAA